MSDEYTPKEVKKQVKQACAFLDSCRTYLAHGGVSDWRAVVKARGPIKDIFNYQGCVLTRIWMKMSGTNPMYPYRTATDELSKFSGYPAVRIAFVGDGNNHAAMLTAEWNHVLELETP